jgi:hypothetical protein
MLKFRLSKTELILQFHLSVFLVLLFYMRLEPERWDVSSLGTPTDQHVVVDHEHFSYWLYLQILYRYIYIINIYKLYHLTLNIFSKYLFSTYERCSPFFFFTCGWNPRSDISSEGTPTVYFYRYICVIHI